MVGRAKRVFYLHHGGKIRIGCRDELQRLWFLCYIWNASSQTNDTISMKNYRSIKHLSPDDRPREKLMEKGRASLSDAEILAILIGSGSRNQSAVDLCRTILHDVGGNLNQLAKLTIPDLMRYRGIGEAKAISIAAALELGRRRKSREFNREEHSVKEAKDIYHLMLQKFEDIDHEEFYAILLSRSNKVKSVEHISRGGISETVADGKIIFKKALEKSAAAVVLCHNHPSGSLRPSQPDIELTQRFKSFGKYIDLPILDHVIVTNEGYYSFAEKGLL